MVAFRVVGEEAGEGELREEQQFGVGVGGAVGQVEDLFDVLGGGAGLAVDIAGGEGETVEHVGNPLLRPA